ncbi:MAG: electron transfer flavoprotein subunit alpha/FixB family protein [Thermodesulfobacteriota bacterium]
MKSEVRNPGSGRGGFWVLVEQRQGSVEESAYGLIAEARRLAGEAVKVTAVGLGPDLGGQLESLGHYGADRVVYVKDCGISRHDGERQARMLGQVIRREDPDWLFMAHSAQTSDLAGRLAALLETGLVTRGVDLRIDETGKGRIIRPIANGYLFEEVQLEGPNPWLVTFLPAVLTPDEPEAKRKAEILVEGPPDLDEPPVTRLESIMEGDPAALDLEESDIIVSGGRGMGNADAFRAIHELAAALGGSVGGTRPVIDRQILPFERQIGQTGKTVRPRLLFACGVSGANEFTAGMEKSEVVVAINTDPRARIFRFADLGVVGDAHEIIPMLVSRLRQRE